MKEIHPFELDDGSQVLMEVEASPVGDGYELAGQAKGKVRRLSNELASIEPAIAQIMSTLKNIEVSPNELEVQFGIKFSAGLGAVFAKASTDANFSVKLKWMKQ